jgi:hypothetical protein
VTLNFPERSWSEWLIAGSIFGVSALHFSVFCRFTQFIGDEGIVLQGAERILQGQVLYRDFFSFLTPGSYYWHALFFKILGSSILVARGVLLVEGAALSTITYLLARRVCNRWSALAGSLCVTLVALPYWFIVLHNWDSTFWALLAAYAAVLFLQTSEPLWVFATGCFSALTCLFEQSKGAGVVAGLAIAAGILTITGHARAHRYNQKFWAAAILGFGLPFVATFGYFYSQHSLVATLQAWLWPLDHYSALNRTPYGYVASTDALADIYADAWPLRVLTILITGPWFFIPLLPLIAIAVVIHCISTSSRTRLETPVRSYYVLVSTVVLGLVVSLIGTGRPDFVHLLYLTPIMFVLAAWVIDGHLFPSFFVRIIAPVLTLAFLVSCGTFGAVLFLKPLNAGAKLSAIKGELKAVRRDELIAYIQRHVSPGESILIYPDQPLYYYLTSTFAPTRFEHLIPGLHEKDQYRQFLRELEAARTRLVVFEPNYRQGLVVGYPAISSELLHEPDPVAAYIVENYRSCADLSSGEGRHFVAMIRNDQSCP